MSNPNIVYIFFDDLGYGDISYLNPESKIQTPNMDRLSAEGMCFTDVHSCSAVCSPSRYGVLTGRYCWRTRLQNGVLNGYSEPLIEPDRLTVASLLKQHGYHTACIGKWHVGLNWTRKKGVQHLEDYRLGWDRGEAIDFTRPFTGGPCDLGFDYFYGISASLDMPPYVYLENNHTICAPTARAPQGLFGREGHAAPGLKPEHVIPDLTKKAVSFIEETAADKQPFFLYYPVTGPHTPIAPNKAFTGKSQAGKYGDFVVECDWAVGQIIDAVEKAGATDNTLFIVTSDNGPERFMHARKEEYNHYSAYHFRGCKRDNWEGGHRIPFIARWPEKVAAGSFSNEIICLTDLIATAADIVGHSLPENASEDSCSILPVLTSQNATSIREATVHHSSKGEFAIRQGKWKLLLHQSSGGNDYPDDPPDDAPGQLYDMETGYRERENLYAQHPEIVSQLTDLLNQYKMRGRSVPIA